MYRIRRLNIGEAELYKSVRLASLLDSPEAFSSRYEDALVRSDASWREQTDSSAHGPDRATFVVLTDGKPAGLAALYRDDHEAGVGELIQMWISPEFRGGSAAKALLDKLFAWAAENEFDRVKAEVEVGNLRALRFYQRYGFSDSADRAAHSQSSLMYKSHQAPCIWRHILNVLQNNAKVPPSSSS